LNESLASMLWSFFNRLKSHRQKNQKNSLLRKETTGNAEMKTKWTKKFFRNMIKKSVLKNDNKSSRFFILPAT